MRIIPIVLLMVVGMAQTTLAQKIGHLNSDLLLTEMPAMKSANKQLETYSELKNKEISQKIEGLNKFYAETMQKNQNGELSPVQQQQKEAELQKKQADLQKAQAAAQEAIVKKQSELYQPVIDKVNAAIKAVGEENGYSYIFNTNAGAVIHFKDADDVTALVKRKLGL